MEIKKKKERKEKIEREMDGFAMRVSLSARGREEGDNRFRIERIY